MAVKPFRVEMAEMPCRCCQRGGLWDVVGPGEIATGTSYGSKEDAEDLAKDMNYAYALGSKQAKSKHKTGAKQ